MLIVYTGLMFAIVWKSFDMTAELKNWVFEWIGGSPRSMGENDGQQKHIMGAVMTAKGAGSQSLGQAARAGANNKQKNTPSTAPKSTGGTNAGDPNDGKM